MDRRRLLQFAFTAVFALFVILLLFQFRPRVEAPAPMAPEQVKHTPEGTLSARGFHYVQETAGKVEFRATAKEVTETPAGLKLLTEPVVTMANGTRAWGKKGSFNPSENSLRIWDDAHLAQPKGWTATSTGFRLTPEGEIVSESSVALQRGTLTGRAELLRYHRETLLAHLEGAVHFEQGPKTMECTAVDLDLKAHTGTMAGPVTLAAEQGTLKAPEGTLLLDDQNRLRSLTLGSPAEGDGPRFATHSRTVVADFDEAGQLTVVHLAGDASVTSKAQPPSTVKSARFDLAPETKDTWDWTAPGALAVVREGGDALAASGKGTFGGPQPETADLSGPVSGRDPRGDFKADSALMRDGDWTLVGHAEVVKPGERLTAHRITFKKDGTSEAEGSVRGWRQQAGQPETTYAAERSKAAAGGYPAKLMGDAQVVRGGMTLKAPLIKVLDARSAVAEGGATGTFVQEDQGTSTVTAKIIRYEGKDKVATAEGGAKAAGRDYTLTGDILRAVLNGEDKPERYEAEGKAVFDGKLYDGRGDLLTYNPATQAGQAKGYEQSAVVIQKDPYRRTAGSVVDFAPKHLAVLPEEGLLRRGSIEGIGPPKAAQGKPKAGSPKGKAGAGKPPAVSAPSPQLPAPRGN